MKRIAPSDDEVHLWYHPIGEDWTQLSYLLQFLAPTEIVELERFQYFPKRREYLMTRGLIRKILSVYASISPRDWIFKLGPGGRPEIGNGESIANQLRFNISHTRDFIAIAVGFRNEIGVDVERVDDLTEIMDLAEAYFSLTEAERLSTLNRKDRVDEFYRIWTLKEAYVKARGVGLSLPTSSFSFELMDQNHIGLQIGKDLDATPERWQFRLLSPTKFHQVALAIQSQMGKEPVIVEKFISLVSQPFPDFTI